MTYVDGFVVAVPTANKETYRKHAEEAAAVFKEHGALSLVECWGDDVPEGKINSMHTAVCWCASRPRTAPDMSGCCAIALARRSPWNGCRT